MNEKNDTNTTLQELKAQMAQFVTEREWDQFHTPKSLSMAIAVEAAELMEKFQWGTEDDARQLFTTDREAIEEEVADVLAVLIAFSNACNIDLTQAFIDKMQKNGKKYPIELSKGSYTKYTKLRKSS